MNKQESDIMKILLQTPFINQRMLAEASGHSLGVVNRSVKELVAQGYLDEQLWPTSRAKKEFQERSPKRAIILAAGFGMRMVPINTEVPKGLLLKYQLDERKVSAGILAVYILSGLSGGIYMGKTAERKRYLWGMILGSIYWGILMLLTIFSGAGTGSGVKGAFLTLLICAGSSTLGAMVTGA